jgi:hypothetical protein
LPGVALRPFSHKEYGSPRSCDIDFVCMRAAWLQVAMRNYTGANVLGLHSRVGAHYT